MNAVNTVNAVFGKTMKNERKNKNIKPVTTVKTKKLFSIRTKFSYCKVLRRNLLAIEMKKSQVLINKSVFLGLSILDVSNTVMYEFWYDYLKPKYGENSNFCYIDTACLIVKNRRYLQRYCKTCWNKIWHFIFWNRETITWR